MASPIVSNEPIKMYITNPKTGKAHPVGCGKHLPSGAVTGLPSPV